jgi:hypothetical protein
VNDEGTLEAIVLSEQAPADVRRMVVELLTAARDDNAAPPELSVARASLLASEMIADAWDHGSEAATVRVCLDEGAISIEVFDGPRRSAIGMSGREDGVPAFRALVLSNLADSWSSDDLGDGHFARGEIRPPSSA